MSMTVSVGQYEDFARAKVEAGEFASLSDVVKEGLRLLKEKQERQAGLWDAEIEKAWLSVELAWASPGTKLGLNFGLGAGRSESPSKVSEKFNLSPSSLVDLNEIWEYVGVRNHNPAAADRLWRDLYAACARLGADPTLGHIRRDLTARPDIRFYCVRQYYLVIYIRGTEPLEIARIMHGARDVRTELAAGPE